MYEASEKGEKRKERKKRDGKGRRRDNDRELEKTCRLSNFEKPTSILRKYMDNTSNKDQQFPRKHDNETAAMLFYSLPTSSLFFFCLLIS